MCACIYIYIYIYIYIVTYKNVRQKRVNPIQVKTLQASVAFHIEPSHLICTANQMTGFYMKYDTGLKWINVPFL